MKLAVRVGLLCVAFSLALNVANASAAATRKPIMGKLSASGYTVIALAASGRATSDRARGGPFKLRPPAGSVTLHLRAEDGTYAGPIVVGRKGKRAIVGVRPGAKLGRVRVNRRKGYARVSKRLRRRWLDASLIARARRGVPIGAGVFGRVRSRPAGGGAPGDRDLDGISGALDIDDDGDLLLDNFERSTNQARAAQAGESPGAPIYLDAQLNLPLSATVNANARPSGSPLTVGDIDAALSTYGIVAMAIVPRESTELDCGGFADPDSPTGWVGGLRYCTRGGSGRFFFGPGRGAGPPPPFPECCDGDRDGFGEIGSNSCPVGEDCVEGFQLGDGAKSAEIGTGNVLIECASSCRAGQTQFAGSLQFVFASIPALVSYRDTAVAPNGPNSGTVSYPVAAPTPGCPPPGCPPGGLGTPGNGLPVAPGPNGEIEVTLTFWRPQRSRIAADPAPKPGESDVWTDIGRLNYTTAFGCDPEGCAVKACPRSAYSTPSGSELTPTTLPDSQGALIDSAPDRAANPGNTFTFTVNLSKCLRDPRGYGIPKNKQLSWTPGQERELRFAGTNLLDNAEQIVYFKLR